MQIDLSAAEIARIARLLHLANDAQDSQLWDKIKEAHMQCVIEPAVIARNVDPMGAPVIQPNPVQHCAEGLTREQSSVAYQRAKERWSLRSAQRSRLDRSPLYSPILRAVHAKEWAKAERLLAHAGIIE